MSLELLELGLNFVGGLMGQSSRKKELAQAQRQFDAQMDQSVQRRVADAKKAGIHPLFAMGASVGSSPTIQAGGGPDPMQTAVQRMASALGVIEQNKASARRDEAEAALLDSERKRIEVDLQGRGRDMPLAELQTEHLAKGISPSYYDTVAKKMPLREKVGYKNLYIQVKDNDTGQMMKLFNPELGLDEIGQVLYADQQGKADRNAAVNWVEKKIREIDTGAQRIVNKSETLKKIQRWIEKTDGEVRRKLQQLAEKLR